MPEYWKILMWLPIALLIVSAGILVNNVLTTGDFLKRDVELSGGKMLTVEVGDDVNIRAVRNALPNANVHLISGAAKQLVIEIPFEADEDAVINELKNVVEVRGEPTLRTIGPVLGEIFFQQAQLSLVVAFVFMSIVVFILFRSLVPSTIVILSVVTDIISTMAIMSVLDIRLSLPVLAALLMIIGYSVDTDILLTTECLKIEKENAKKAIKHAVKTGLTMTATTVVALFALYSISASFVLQQIASVLIIGLVVDVFATWLTNTGLLRWWIEKKVGK